MTESESIERQVWLRAFLTIIKTASVDSTKITLAEALSSADYVADHFSRKYPDPDSGGTLQ